MCPTPPPTSPPPPPRPGPEAEPPAADPALLALMPYAVALGVELESASAQQAVGHLKWAPQRCTAGGVLHGGALMGLADSIGAICAYLGLPAGASTATTSSTCFAPFARAGSRPPPARCTVATPWSWCRPTSSMHMAGPSRRSPRPRRSSSDTIRARENGVVSRLIVVTGRVVVSGSQVCGDGGDPRWRS